ncbi:MAG: DUF4097 family beta strand repeat-containing protein [Actinomycetales bacterium]
MPTFQTPAPITASVELGGAGDLTVIAGDRTDTVVDVYPRNESSGADVRAAEQTRVDYADGRLLVKAAKHWKQYSLFGTGGAVEIIVRLPAGSGLDISLAMGGVRGEGRFGECRVTTAMGNIRLDATGAAELKTSYGEITVGYAAGRVNAATGSGSVRIREIDGSAVIKNSNGDTSLGMVSGDLRVNAANGDITVERAGGPVSAKTANGGIRLAEVSRGTVTLDAAAGSLEVGIADGIAAWLDLNSKFGRVSSSLIPTGNPAEVDPAVDPGEPVRTVEVRARTSYGDITIHRSISSQSRKQP